MNHGFAAMLLERIRNEIAISDVPSSDDGGRAGDTLDASDDLNIAVAEIVKYDDLMPSIDQFNACMGANVTGPTCDHNLHVQHQIS
jgi:hypothetical protein